MALLRPLLLDNVPSIQQSAALALGRLANYSDELAEAVVSNEILPQLVYSLSEQNVSLHYNFQTFPLRPSLKTAI
jgi:HEAT repeat protein